MYCFTPYLTFFDPLGIILSVIIISVSWKHKQSRTINVLSILVVLVISVGIGLSSFDNIGAVLLNLPVPRMRGGQFLPGTTALVDFITNKFGLALTLTKRYLASALGLIVGLGVLLIAFVISRRMKGAKTRPGFAYILLNVFLAMGLLLSPVLQTGGSRADCEQDILSANEKLGAYLASVIPADSLVYWDGGLSFVPMVYIPNVRFFPPQINDGYTYRVGGDSDTLFRFSHWNSELNDQWMDSADIFIIEAKRYSTWKEFLNPQEFEEYQKPITAPSCEDGAGLRIFHRLP